MSIEIGETAICSITIKNSAGTLVDPDTSVNITVFKPANVGGLLVDDQACPKDSTGTYHYDIATTGVGDHKLIIVAIDGSRTTKKRDRFTVVAEKGGG